MISSRTVACLGVLVAVLLFILPACAYADSQDVRPNIVVIMTDDQDIATMSILPKIQAMLADQGTSFETYITTYSKCCPSRASFLTGQYPHNNGVEANGLPRGSYAKLDHGNTLAVWLQDSGYYTGHIGKYLNGYGQLDSNPGDGIPAWQEIPPGYSEWYGTIDPTTYHYYNYSMNMNGRYVRFGNSPGDYQTDIFTGMAVHFIRRRASSTDGKPFFLVIAPLAPHHESTLPVRPEPAPRHKDSFSGEPLPIPPSFNEADMSDKPWFMQRKPLLDQRLIDAMTFCYRSRLETLLAVDDMVESVVNTLADTAMLDNTYIFFTSDNGWMQGEHRVPFGKEFAYEPSIRVPLIIRGPRFPSGMKFTGLVANVDLAPTIIEATGAEPLLVMDGISLLTQLKGQTRRNGILIECKGLDVNGDGEGGMESENGMLSMDFDAVRTDDYTYVSYRDVIFLNEAKKLVHMKGGEELYDLTDDPYQLQNVAANTLYGSIRRGLRGRLEVLKSCSGSTCW